METSHSNFIDCGSHKFNKLHKCVFRSISYYSAVFPRILHYSPLYTLFSTILTVLYYSLLFFSIPYYSPLYTLFSTIVTISIVLQHSPLFSIIIHYIHFPKIILVFPTILYYQHYSHYCYHYSQLFLTIPQHFPLYTLFSTIITILYDSLLFPSIPKYSYTILDYYDYSPFKYRHYSPQFHTMSQYSPIFPTIPQYSFHSIHYSQGLSLFPTICQYSLLYTLFSSIMTILHCSPVVPTILPYIHYSQLSSLFSTIPHYSPLYSLISTVIIILDYSHLFLTIPP